MLTLIQEDEQASGSWDFRWQTNREYIIATDDMRREILVSR